MPSLHTSEPVEVIIVIQLLALQQPSESLLSTSMLSYPRQLTLSVSLY